ncbi:MAG: DUF3783 domain-containing protein [Clostridia bacterium]|nr:DUF3783 domain-containing protein [Clostridia bacterium]
MIPPTVLTFNLPPDVHARMRGLAAALGIRVKAVPPESFATPIGAMLGIPAGPADAPAEAGCFSDPMLLMCSLNEAQFNRFLQLLRGPGLPRIPLKAVLTPHNVGWNAFQLHAELSREHEAMTRGRGT